MHSVDAVVKFYIYKNVCTCINMFAEIGAGRS